MNEHKVINYWYQYQNWHKNSEESLNYDIAQNIILLNEHNIYPPEKNSNVLELGCANGHFMQTLKVKGYSLIKGVDISCELVKEAQSLNLDVTLDDALNFLKISNQKYDVIYCLDLLEHIEKDKQIELLSLINNSLTYQGFLVLKVPNALSPLESYFRYIDFTHQLSYTKDSLSFLLLNAGFEDFVFRAQHLEDEHLRLAKHNYAFMLYKQFGLTKQILTPNIIAIVFKNSENKRIYQNQTQDILNDYYEYWNDETKEIITNRHILKMLLEINQLSHYKKIYKLFDFLCYITLNRFEKLKESKMLYKNLYLNALTVKNKIENLVL